ncbi:MAG: hypothetical protein ACKOA5_00335, partial [Actinomycetota bacterium]
MTGVDDLLSYLDESPSPYHAVAATVARLADRGFSVRSHAAADDALFAEARGVLTHDHAMVAPLWLSTPRASAK